MPALRYQDIANRPITVLDMTRLTIDAFALLVPLLDTAFLAHMAEWRLDGKPRTTRSYTTYANCPLPTPEDRLLFILVYHKTNSLQVAHGLMFGLPQGKANQWIHLLVPLLRDTLRQRRMMAVFMTNGLSTKRPIHYRTRAHYCTIRAFRHSRLMGSRV